jgi:glycogen(starch) synthase
VYFSTEILHIRTISVLCRQVLRQRNRAPDRNVTWLQNKMTNTTQEPKLSVLLLGPYPPPHGGVEISLASLQDFLLQQEVYCEVINLTRHRKAEAGGVYYPTSAMDVVRLLLKRKAEIIHMHIGGDVSWRLLGLGLVCSVLPNRKLVLTLHSGGYPSSPAGKAARPMSLRGFLFRRFDGLIGVNQELVDMFVKFGVPPAKIRLILPSSMPARVPDVALPDTIRIFFAMHNPVLLTVSGLESEYDLPAQIEALGFLRKLSPGAGLLIVGAGSLETDIRNRISATGYSDHVLLAGDVPHEVVLRIMSLSDVLLRTTLYDGDSIAVREALHFGLSVIATDNGMRPEGAILVPVADQTALCQAIRQTLDKPQMRQTSPGAETTNLRHVIDFYRQLLSAA